MALTSAQQRIYTRRPQPNRALIELRLNTGLTPNALGYRARVSGNTVRSAERGFYIDVPQQHAIASALGTTVTALFPMERQRIAA